MEKYIGYFFSAECDAEFDIRLDNNKLLNYRNAEGPIEMKPAYKDALYMEGVLIEFKLSPRQKIIL